MPDADVESEGTRVERRIPVLRMYLLGAATLGLYLLFWVYRRARADQEDREDPTRPWVWPAATLVPPLACVVLFDFARSDAAALASRGQSSPSPWIPVLLHAVITGVLIVAPFVIVWSAFWLLWPLAFVWVQHQRNRRLSAEMGDEVASASGAAGQWAMVAVALPLALGAGWWLDAETFRQRLRPQEVPGERIAGESGLYTVATMAPGWRRATIGTHGDDDADLELVDASGTTWAIAYVNPGRDQTLDARVDMRRGLIGAEQPINEQWERRQFLEGADYVPVSLARYAQHVAGSDYQYAVLTVALDESLIEIIGFTRQPDRDVEDLLDLLRSFRLAEPAPLEDPS